MSGDTVNTSACFDPESFRSFSWTQDNAKKAQELVARYPDTRQASAILPLLHLAQRQMGEQTGHAWLPVPVIEYVAGQLDMAPIRAMEVATFYTMFNIRPVGRFHVQVCGTTPCMLRGSLDIMEACRNKGLKKGEITNDGLFTLSEVECMGTCANAPMVQINDENYEDLTPESMTAILDALEQGRVPPPGSQKNRLASSPEAGLTTLEQTVTPNA